RAARASARSQPAPLRETPTGRNSSLVVLGTGIGLWLALYLRFGREYPEPDVPEYLREPLAGWRPIEVGYLWRWGKLDLQDMIAMVMDLVRRGALRIELAQGA